MFKRTYVGLETLRRSPPRPMSRPRTNCVLPAPSWPWRAMVELGVSVRARFSAIACVSSTECDSCSTNVGVPRLAQDRKEARMVVRPQRRTDLWGHRDEGADGEGSQEILI